MGNLQNRESGHAALLFVLLFPALFSLFALGSDGARALQDKARLEEASEVAALIVAAGNSDSESDRKSTAKKIIQAYFPSASISDSDIEVTKLSCEENSDCDADDLEGQRFFEYGVVVTISQDSWFYSESSSASSMGENYQVGGTSTARKYQSEAVDVVLVADYSGSMDDTWDGGSQKKYKDLNDIIVEVAAELDSFNEISADDEQNKLAVVGFNYFTAKIEGNSTLYAHHLSCNSSSTSSNSNKACLVVKNNKNLYWYEDNIKYQDTVDNIFNEDLSSWISLNKTFSFYTIPLSEPLSDPFNSTYMNSNFKGNGGTASYTGIIRGAQVAATGTNPRRLIIILSDGVDSISSVTTELINKGLCSTILEKLNSDEVTTKLAAVGFDYDIDSNPQMAACVGEDNVYKAENTADIKNKILELISEEIGHSAL
ncbi:hypothetical protein ACMUMQ_12205 [Marinomonas sp. 2405UD66-6]|uniref:TadE/TadG family type IV pilus assembly protein n=1 Tax=Marinomonas sp. 2405UD66-6 TaxID=3391834 RepID=UPI0039C942EF